LTPPGWRQWASDIERSFDSAESQDGSSFHVTSAAGASVSLSFYGPSAAVLASRSRTYARTLPGIGIIARGESNGSYDVAIDDAVFSGLSHRAGDVLYASDRLRRGRHTAVLTARPSGENEMLLFDSFVVTNPILPHSAQYGARFLVPRANAT
jgi:hypothetical protein